MISPVCPSAQEALDALSVNVASPPWAVALSPAAAAVTGSKVSTMQQMSRMLKIRFLIIIPLFLPPPMCGFLNSFCSGCR